jgi:hypothetical protein
MFKTSAEKLSLACDYRKWIFGLLSTFYSGLFVQASGISIALQAQTFEEEKEKYLRKAGSSR